MYAGIHTAAIDRQLVYLFPELLGGVFTTLQLHAAALDNIGASVLFFGKCGQSFCKLGYPRFIFPDLIADLPYAGLRL